MMRVGVVSTWFVGCQYQERSERMVRRKKNVLLGMNANEKKFMRKVVDVFEKRGFPKDEWRERKIEALEEFRDQVRRQCSECIHGVVTAEIERMTPGGKK